MKAFTDIQQSKKLAEILPLDSSDHHYVRKVCDFRGNAVDGEWSWPKYGNINSKYANYIVQNFTRYEEIPCWSLAALLNSLPCPILERNYKSKWFCRCECKDTIYVCEADNPVSACYEMIIKLHEQNIL